MIVEVWETVRASIHSPSFIHVPTNHFDVLFVFCQRTAFAFVVDVCGRPSAALEPDCAHRGDLGEREAALDSG